MQFQRRETLDKRPLPIFQQPLPLEEKQHNQALARVQVRVKHVIRRFKIFRIFSGRYHNHRKRFGLRLNLIAGLLNYELAHAS
jgi:hypothetical protein